MALILKCNIISPKRKERIDSHLPQTGRHRSSTIFNRIWISRFSYYIGHALCRRSTQGSFWANWKDLRIWVFLQCFLEKAMGFLEVITALESLNVQCVRNYYSFTSYITVFSSDFVKEFIPFTRIVREESFKFFKKGIRSSE